MKFGWDGSVFFLEKRKKEKCSEVKIFIPSAKIGAAVYKEHE